MAFILFDKVKYNVLASELINTKELNFEVANVFVDVDNKQLILDTNNGRADINFDDHEKLLDSIIRIGEELYFQDMLHALDLARDDLTLKRRYSQLEMAENEITNLLSEIEKAKKNLFDSNFTLMIKIGELEDHYIDSFTDDHPEIKNVIENGIERYRELCWKTYESDFPNYCDYVIPVIYADVYAVPEDKRIMIIINVDQIGEVYRLVKGYDTSYNFLKALEEYEGIVVSR